MDIFFIKPFHCRHSTAIVEYRNDIALLYNDRVFIWINTWNYTNRLNRYLQIYELQTTGTGIHLFRARKEFTLCRVIQVNALLAANICITQRSNDPFSGWGKHTNQKHLLYWNNTISTQNYCEGGGEGNCFYPPPPSSWWLPLGSFW